MPEPASKPWPPEIPCTLLAATLAIEGGGYWVCYRLEGGLGSTDGGFFILDRLRTPVINLAGMAAAPVLLVRGAGLVLVVPWISLSADDADRLARVLVANLLFWYARVPALRWHFCHRREVKLPDDKEAAGLTGEWSLFRTNRPQHTLAPSRGISRHREALGGLPWWLRVGTRPLGSHVLLRISQA